MNINRELKIFTFGITPNIVKAVSLGIISILITVLAAVSTEIIGIAYRMPNAMISMNMALCMAFMIGFSIVFSIMSMFDKLTGIVVFKTMVYFSIGITFTFAQNSLSLDISGSTPPYQVLANSSSAAFQLAGLLGLIAVSVFEVLPQLLAPLEKLIRTLQYAELREENKLTSTQEEIVKALYHNQSMSRTDLKIVFKLNFWTIGQLLKLASDDLIEKERKTIDGKRESVYSLTWNGQELAKSLLPGEPDPE